MSATAAKAGSATEYLSMVAASREWLEWVDGVVQAVPEPTPTFANVSANCTIFLAEQLKDGRQMFICGLRAHLPERDAFVYPTITMTLEDPVPSPADPSHSSLLNPAFVLEVLSATTEVWTRGRKLSHYLRHASLKEVVLVDPAMFRVERYSRDPQGKWTYEQAIGPGTRLELPGIGVTLELDVVFAGTWPEEGSDSTSVTN